MFETWAIGYATLFIISLYIGVFLPGTNVTLYYYYYYFFIYLCFLTWNYYDIIGQLAHNYSYQIILLYSFRYINLCTEFIPF